MSNKTSTEPQTPTSTGWPHMTNVALSLSRSELQESLTKMLEHIFCYPPEEPDIDYNLAVSTMFEILRHTFKMKEEYDMHITTAK